MLNDETSAQRSLEYLLNTTKIQDKESLVSVYEEIFDIGVDKMAMTIGQVIERRGIEIGIKKGRQEGKQEGKQEGRQEGRQEGKNEARNEFALRLLKEKSKLEFIVKVTGLSIDELNKLQKHAQ